MVGHSFKLMSNITKGELNKIRLRTEPYGTPHDMGDEDETRSSIHTLKDLSEREEENQLRAVPTMPTQYLSFSNKM